MALIGSYSVGGSFSSVTLSKQYDNIDDLLIQIPDNTSGMIAADDVRDSVYSLWQKIESVSASSSSTQSIDYISSTPSTVSVGGLPVGSTFSGTIQDVFNRMFYPYVAPGANLTSNFGTEREFGDTSGYSFNLIWSATQNSNPITQIIVNGVLQTNSPLSGIVPATSTHSVSPGVQSQQTYTMSVSDGTSTSNSTTTVTWRNKVYWGTLDGVSVGNPDLTSFPGSASSLGSIVSNSTILGLTGSELSITKNRTFTEINGGGRYLLFAWPSSVTDALTPNFTVNGLPNTAFTRLKTNWTFTNLFGFSTSYEVWVSNTIQNSPLNIIIS
jgi:hypothetical protein